MSKNMVILGMGYTASLLAEILRARGWLVTGVRREAGPDIISFDDDTAVRRAIHSSSHILSSVPPDPAGLDPVLERYGPTIAECGAAWTGYLSSTGVYGDAHGAWVDESAPIGGGRRSARTEADLAWQALRDPMHIFRLPGIYGRGRSALERVRSGSARRIDLPGQVFSRIHVDDIVTAIMASFGAPAGVYNIADDLPCGQNAVIEYACMLLGIAFPPLLRLEEAGLSPQSLAFYAENRKIANGKAKHMLGWRPHYPDYREGLRACFPQ